MKKLTNSEAEAVIIRANQAAKERESSEVDNLRSKYVSNSLNFYGSKRHQKPMNKTEKEVSISRDPFARGNVMRKKASGECAWCGQPAKFQYGWNADSISNHTSYNNRVFCSISCSRAYNS